MRVFLNILFVFSTSFLFSQEEETLPERSKVTDAADIKKKDTLQSSVFNQKIILDEVAITPSKYNAVSLGIIKKELKPLSPNERRLYTAGDFKPIHLLSILGGTLAIDPIINKISGRTNRLKKYIEIEKNIKNFEYILYHYSDYMQRNLNIDEALLGQFVDYLLANEQVSYLMENKIYTELPFIIGDTWFEFQKRQK